MIKSRRLAVLAILGGALSVGAWMTARTTRGSAGSGTAAVTADSGQAPSNALVPPSDAALLEQDLAFYARRVAEDPQGAADRATLAALHLQRARMTGNSQDHARAESLATQSLSLRADRNDGAVATLAAALLARHAFAEARAVVRRADSLAPGNASTIAALAEIELELGDYDAARVHFERVRPEAFRATVGPRLARWYELTGGVDRARGILRRAAQQFDDRDDLPREQVAWFHYRLGELELRAGELDSAEASFRRGLARWPDDYRILAAMARLAAARGQWREAIAQGERAVALQLDPGTLGVISEANRALGDTVQAAQWAEAMRVSALSQPGPIHRGWGLFLLDHGSARDAREVLVRAQRELRERQDVYGHDLHAWALYRSGRTAEARAAMTRALSQGTEDPQLDVHAGVIAWAVGDTAGARTHLVRALRVSPTTPGPAWMTARAILDSLAVRRG
jgi:tetratricopeptide (TPR) repeat protein